jgi:tight adherence protein C
MVGALLLGGAVFYLIFTTQQAAENSAAEDRLGLNWGSTENTFKAPFYLQLTRPLLKGPYLKLAASFWKPEQLENWKIKIISTGLGRNVEPEHFVASKFWLSSMVGSLLFLAYLFASDPPSLTMCAVITVLAFFVPNLHLNGLRTQRQTSVRLAMPYVVDLLTLSIEAGLDFMGAVGKVVERAPPSPLHEELSTLLKDIQLGKTRAQALRAMGDRLDMPEISSFVAVIISSDQMGASVGTVLRAQSDSMRNERLTKAEKMGAAASQKILIPLIMFILPAVLLVIFGPIVMQAMGIK